MGGARGRAYAIDGGICGWMVCVDWGDVGVVMDGVAWGWQPLRCRGWCRLEVAAVVSGLWKWQLGGMVIEITKDGKVIGTGIRKKGLYVMKLRNKPKDQICLATIDENSTLRHRRLGHVNMRLIKLLASKGLVRNLPKLKFDQHFYDACKIGKQVHASHKAKNIISTNRCLELLHVDLFGPSVVRSYGGNRYTLVIVDDYSRYTWTRFLKEKTEAFDQFEIYSKKIQNQLECTIVSIRTDHGREFDNEVQFREFCNANGITHNSSTPRTPQSNDVVKRKNRTLQEMSRTMVNEQSLPQTFWCNAVDTSTYLINRILTRAILGKTPYELLGGRKPTLDYFRVFGSECFILNTKYYLTKFDLKSYEGVFLRYSQNIKGYIIHNKHTRKIKESLNATFDENPPPSKTPPLVDDDLDEEEAIKITENKNLEKDIEDESLEIDEIVNITESKNHPLENVIGSLNQRTLRLVAQGYNQQEGIDYDKTYAQLLDLKSIRILLSYACALDFKLFQMDVKSAFLNSFINEEVYMAQPLGFIDFEKPDHVYKPKKALYGLKQASKAWPDIMFSICLCACFQEAPKTSHLESVNRIFRYIKGTTHLRLWYPKGIGIETIVYAESDHAGDYVDQKSTSGIYTFVGCCLTSWFLKKQTALAISTTEAEYSPSNHPHEIQHLNIYLSETINLQTQQRDAHREGLRSIGQALKDMMSGKRKELVDIVKSRVGYSGSGAGRRDALEGGVVGLGVRVGNTITPIRGGYVVGIPIHSGNTSSAGRGGDVVCLGVVASSIGGGLVGIGHGSGSIALLEVINDCMSPQPSDNSEEKNKLPATHGPRSSTFSH
uniref:Retrovirus-related Pol polyprotein from transposon TNT 1-94 n=1 Tax=Tanacetum cinerariifolium TaxID=118510 RepID=A0A6L2NTM8_TANCI|nr:retrovirus-related Pol polyprotein from transposon TNT 1-94 [Tanacetum cinerariifolium]